MGSSPNRGIQPIFSEECVGRVRRKGKRKKMPQNLQVKLLAKESSQPDKSFADVLEIGRAIELTKNWERSRIE